MKAKICNAIISETGVKHLLHREGAIDENLKISNRAIFNEQKSNFRTHLGTVYNVDSDILYEDNGFVGVNAEVIGEVRNQMFKKVTPPIHFRYENSVDEALKYRALEKLRTMLPGTTLETLNSNQIAKKYGNRSVKSKGFFTGDSTIVINTDNFKLDTPFHEYAHLVLKFLKGTAPDEYANIVKKSLKHHTAGDIRIKYPNLTEEALGEEIFVTQIGLRSAEVFAKSTTLMGKIRDFFRSFMGKLFGFNPTAISLNDSVDSLIKKYADKIIKEPETLFRDLEPSQVQSILSSMEIVKDSDIEQHLIRDGYIKRVNGERVYFDHSGKRADSYYKNLKAKGKEKALHTYIQSMRRFVDIRYSKVGKVKTIEDGIKIIDAMDADLKLVDGDARYGSISDPSDTYRRSTSFMYEGVDDSGEGFVDVFEARKVATRSAELQTIGKLKADFYADEVKREQQTGYKKLTRKEKTEKADLYAKGELPNVPQDEIDVLIQKALDLYDFKRETGTFVHSLAENFINARQHLVMAKEENTVYEYRNGKFVERPSRVSSKSKKKGFVIITDPTTGKEMQIFNNEDLGFYLSKLSITIRSVNKRDPANLPGYIAKERATYYKELNAQLREFEKGKKKMVYKTEVKLKSDKLGFAGSIDLLAIEEGGKAYVIDHKTKEDNAKTRASWNSPNGDRLKGELSSYQNNARTSASIQTAMYRLMLEELGFDTSAVGIVFYTEGTVMLGMEGYKNMKVGKRTLEDMKEDIIRVYAASKKDIRGISVKHSDDIHDSVLSAFEGIDPDGFSANEKTVNSIHATSGTQVKYGNPFFGYKFMGMSYPYPVTILESDKKGQKAHIAKLYNNKSKILEEESRLEAYFNDPSSEPSMAKRHHLDRRLKGLSADTHELIRVSKKSVYGENYAGILLFRNKLNNQHRVLVLRAVNDKKRYKLGGNNKTIFGGMMNDVEIRRKILVNRSMIEASAINMKMMKVYGVLAKMKVADPAFSIEYVVSAPLGASDSPLLPYDFDSLAVTAEHFYTEAAKAKKLKGDIKSIIKTPRIFDGTAYSADMYTQLHAFFESRPLIKGIYETAADELDAFMLDQNRDIAPLTQALVQIMNTGSNNLNDEERRLIEHAVAYTQGLSIAAIGQDIDSLEKFMITPQSYESVILQKMTSLTSANRRRSRHTYLEYSNEHHKAIEAFKGKNYNAARIGTDSSYKRLFRPMDTAHPENFYRLRSETDPSLSAKEVTYIKKWKSMLKDALLFNSLGKQSDKDRVAAYIDKGYVPLVYPGKIKTILKSDNKLENLRKSMEQQMSIGSSEEGKWNMKLSFNGELSGDNTMQGTDERRNKLGIDDDNVAAAIPVFEMDLETVLDQVMGEAVLIKYGNNTLAAAKALTNELTYQQLKLDKENKGLIDVIDILARVNVKGFKADTQAEKFAGMTGGLATKLNIAASAGSITVEGVTNIANTAKLWVQESVMARVFGVESRFTTRHMAKAMVLISTDYKKARAIMLEFGITEPDPKQLKKFLALSEKNKIFKEDNLFGLQALFLSLAQTEVVIASMLKDGTYEAYGVSEAGNLTYDEKKDKRFHGATTPEAKEKQAMFKEKLDTILRQENKVDSKGDLNMGYTDLELKAMKDYVVEAFSSMDVDSKNPATFAFFGKLQGKYRTWILPRVARMFGKSSQKRMSNFKWEYVYDEDGKLMDVIPQFGLAEGYLYTIGRLLNAGTTALRTDKPMSKLSDFEKLQLSKAFSDLFIVMSLYGIYAATKCSDIQKKEGTCWHETVAGKVLHKAILAAPGDVLVFIALGQVAVGSQSAMMPGLAGIQRSAINLVKAGVYAAEGEGQKAEESIAKVVTGANYIYKFVNEDRLKRLKEGK